jgi:pimeloyl-ACP methyl ester carboxylesterase
MTALHPHQLKHPGTRRSGPGTAASRSSDRRLLHGASWTTGPAAPQVDALRDRYQVVVPDLRGHGHSTGPVTFEAPVGDASVMRWPCSTSSPPGTSDRSGLSLGANIANDVVAPPARPRARAGAVRRCRR